VPTPAFAIARRTEIRVDDPRHGVVIRRFVREEGPYFLLGRRQACEIKRQAPDQCQTVGVRTGSDARLFQPGEDEPINVVADPALILDRGGLGLGNRPERPGQLAR
jgi:hypothetical protein